MLLVRLLSNTVNPKFDGIAENSGYTFALISNYKVHYVQAANTCPYKAILSRCHLRSAASSDLQVMGHAALLCVPQAHDIQHVYPVP